MFRLSANLSTMFGELPFPERISAVQKAGFAAVEVQYPYDYTITEIQAALEAAGIGLVLLNAPRGSRPNDRGLAALPGREAEFRDGIELALSYSTALGNRFIHVLSGTPEEGMEREACVQTWHSNMEWAVQKAQAARVELLIEALNPVDVPGYFIRSLDEAVTLLEMIEGPGIGLLFDVYHCAKAGEPVVAQIHALAGWTRHVQIADSPARGEPGTGDIHWPDVFTALLQTGYQGFVGAEYTPRNGTLEGLAWARPYLNHS